MYESLDMSKLKKNISKNIKSAKKEISHYWTSYEPIGAPSPFDSNFKNEIVLFIKVGSL